MAFKPSIAKPSNASAINPAETGIEGVLVPDPVRQAELEDKGPAAVEAASSSAHVLALRTMNAVRTIAPILSVAVTVEGDSRDQAACFARLLSRSTELARQTLSAMGYDVEAARNRWMINVLERGFSEIVALDKEIDEGLVKALAQALPEHAFDPGETQDLSKDNAIGVSIVQAMLPIVLSQQKFDFFRNKDQDLEAARALLLEEVAKTIEVLLAPMTGTEERLRMLSLLCQEAGKAFADAWDREAERAKEVLSRKTKSEIGAWRQANPQGFPIDTVYKRFKETMHRIRALSKIAPVK